MDFRIGVIGTGFSRVAHLPIFRDSKNVEVVAVASGRMENAVSAAIEFGVPHAYDDWQKMLDGHPFDLICVSTPVSTHFPIVNAAISAGAHVLCDTPAAMNAPEATSMLREARKFGKQLFINHELRYEATRKKIWHLISSGAIGELRHIRIQNITSGWYDPAGRSSNDWWSNLESGGGRLLANAPHQIDLLRWWGGEISAVSGRLRTIVSNRTDHRTGQAWLASADDFCEMSLDMQSGATASVSLYAVSPNEIGNRIQIFGSHGTIILDERERLTVSRAGGEFVDETPPNLDEKISIWGRGVAALLPDLLACLAENRPVPEGMTFKNAISNQIVLDAVRQSSLKRCWIDVKAEDELTPALSGSLKS